MPRLNVVIAGAGLCGPVLALALEKYAPDVESEIYEATSELTTAGAGIGLQNRSMYILHELGLEEALLKIAGNGANSKLPSLHRKSDQAEGVTFKSSKQDDIEESFTFHRGELQRAVVSRLRSSERIHLGKRFASYAQAPDGKVEVRFQDGSTTTCDLLVGCDGIRSGVRAAMYNKLADAAAAAGREGEAGFLRSCVPAAFSGTVVYRGLVKPEEVGEGKPEPLNRTHTVMYCGKNKHLVAYPIMQGHTINIAAAITYPELAGTVYEGPWTTDVVTEDVKQSYAGWEPEVEEILQNVGSWSKWAMNVVKELPTFVDGHVALVGDAAHAMTPYQGAGAGQGFEDCLLLGQLLGHPGVTPALVPTALKVYDEIRRPVAQDVAAKSLKSGELQSLIGPEFADVTPEMSATGHAISAGQLGGVGQDMLHLTEWRKGTTVEKDCHNALKRLQEELAATA